MGEQESLIPGMKQMEEVKREVAPPPKKDWDAKTKGGYDFGEVASAMQKEIRRGNEVKAVYWAAILYKSGYSKYLKRRIHCIMQEDIGIANPQAMIMGYLLKIDAEGKKRDPKLEVAEHDGDGFTPILNTILLACRGKKTRVSDNLLNLTFDSIDKWGVHLEIEDYAIDPHSDRGKELWGRWESGTKEQSQKRIQMWFDVWAMINNEIIHDEEGREVDPYKEKLKKAWGYYDVNKAPVKEDR